jgi:hypothetical protein
VSFAWTKFQDFYLRLGFLKVLVSALDESRRSAINDTIERRLRTPVFAPAQNFDALWARVKGHDFPKKKPRPRRGLAAAEQPYTTVAEALLVDGGCPSLLYAITPDTLYKILDWGHDVQLMGRGNQITERSLILRTLMPMDRAGRFLTGDVDAWNPFVLTTSEKIFFLYHLGQLDHILIDLIDRLAGEPAAQPLESSAAAKLLCRTFLKVLERAEPGIALRDAATFRVAKELACVIADEQGMGGESRICAGGTQLSRLRAKRTVLLPAGKAERKANKNSDHQTIPRFEQLADLGFVTKGTEGKADDRRRWRYTPATSCQGWRAVRQRYESGEAFFEKGFAKAVVAAFGLGDPSTEPDLETIARYFWKAYEVVHRPVGHTPFDSVALVGLIYAAEAGIPIEIGHFHDMMLRIKNEDLLPGMAFFASGNEIDKMFLVLKPGFVDALVSKVNAGENV